MPHSTSNCIFVRKTCFVKYSQAFVVLPGGFGTMDELSLVHLVDDPDEVVKIIKQAHKGMDFGL